MKRLQLFLVPLLATAALAQGPLAPSFGPAPTMKTLAEIEGRTPISSLPFSITAAGSYYLTKSLQFSASSGHAISITASNVTLDFSGFSLTSTDAVTGSAISIDGARTGVRIRNGSISGNSTVVVSGLFPGKSWSATPKGFFNGISAFSTQACEFSDLGISGCQADGLDLGGTSLIQRVNARGNGGYGIDTNNLGNRISSCTASRNVNSGIFCNAGIITATVVTENGNHGMTATGCVVSSSSARGNFANGFNAGSAVLSNCASNDNGGHGILADLSNLSLSTSRNNNLRASTFVDISASAGTARYGNLPTP